MVEVYTEWDGSKWVSLEEHLQSLKRMDMPADCLCVPKEDMEAIIAAIGESIQFARAIKNETDWNDEGAVDEWIKTMKGAIAKWKIEL